jgi:hypothetical protein
MYSLRVVPKNNNNPVPFFVEPQETRKDKYKSSQAKYPYKPFTTYTSPKRRRERKEQKDLT